MNTIMIPACKCAQCNHIWVKRSETAAKRCPRCQSDKWAQVGPVGQIPAGSMAA